MTTLMTNDLTIGKELDRAALTDLTGGRCILLFNSIPTGILSYYNQVHNYHYTTIFHNIYI